MRKAIGFLIDYCHNNQLTDTSQVGVTYTPSFLDVAPSRIRYEVPFASRIAIA